MSVLTAVALEESFQCVILNNKPLHLNIGRHLSLTNVDLATCRSYPAFIQDRRWTLFSLHGSNFSADRP